jgi:hypothetical protein
MKFSNELSNSKNKSPSSAASSSAVSQEIPLNLRNPKFSCCVYQNLPFVPYTESDKSSPRFRTLFKINNFSVSVYTEMRFNKLLFNGNS